MGLVVDDMTTMAIAQHTTDDMATVPRPIERLPVRKSSADQKEAMNCKSCRKRKVCALPCLASSFSSSSSSSVAARRVHSR